MPGVTGVSNLSNAVKVKYQTDFLLAAAEKQVWGQLVDWDGVAMGQGGSSFEAVAFQPMDSEDTSAILPESDDIAATVLKDASISITPYEYGRRVALTSKVRFQSHVSVREAAAKMVGGNMVETVDKAIRRGILAGTSNIYRVGGLALRTDLDATSDKITVDFLAKLAARAFAMGLEPLVGEDFVCPIHPLLEPDILALTEVKGVGYNFPDIIYKGEFARLCGIRFVRTRMGKIYLSGGTVAQSATTIDADAAAGATALSVASATGLAVGNYITVGTLEGVNAEQVQITAVSGTDLTIQGIGNAPDNWGLKFAHASGEAVTEAANVVALPIIGKNSLRGVYGSEWGKFGMSVIKEGTDTLDRLLSIGWKWYGGVGIFEKYLIRGECAISAGTLGDN